jgi:hypothetical protein
VLLGQALQPMLAHRRQAQAAHGLPARFEGVVRLRISRHRGHPFHAIADSISRQGGHRFTLIADSVSA